MVSFSVLNIAVAEKLGWVLRLIFAEYVSLASQSTYPIIVYSVANYRPHLPYQSVKTRIDLFFTYPILVTLLKILSHYSQSSRENATPSSGTSPYTP